MFRVSVVLFLHDFFLYSLKCYYRDDNDTLKKKYHELKKEYDKLKKLNCDLQRTAKCTDTVKDVTGKIETFVK